MANKIKCNNAVRESTLNRWVLSVYLKRGRESILRMSDRSEFQSFQSSVYHWGVTTQTKYERGWDTTHHTQDIFTRETHRTAVGRQDEAGCVAQRRDTEAHTHARWVMGSQTQQRVTQPKGCSLTLIVCREESALGFITPVVSGERENQPQPLWVFLPTYRPPAVTPLGGPATGRLSLNIYHTSLFFFCPVTFVLPCRQSDSRRVISNVSPSDKLWFAAVHVDACADVTHQVKTNVDVR